MRVGRVPSPGAVLDVQSGCEINGLGFVPNPGGMRDNSPMLQHWDNQVNGGKSRRDRRAVRVSRMPPTMHDMKRRSQLARPFLSGLETSFIFDRLESLLDQGLDNAIQVRLRVGEEPRIFVVVSINNERLRRRDEPEINPVTQCSLKECPNLLLSHDINRRLPLERRRQGLAGQK